MSEPAKSKRFPSIVTINHEADSNATALFVPGLGYTELVGPTSGSEYEKLKLAEAQKQELNGQLNRIFAEDWVCTECKAKYPRIRWDRATGMPVSGQRCLMVEFKVSWNTKTGREEKEFDRIYCPRCGSDKVIRKDDERQVPIIEHFRQETAK